MGFEEEGVSHDEEDTESYVTFIFIQISTAEVRLNSLR
jgi:hypothetical protein